MASCGRADCQWGDDCPFTILTRFAQLVGIPATDESAFMFMGTCENDGHPKLWQYKHYDTRSYLHLDEAGHAFEHHMTDDGCAAVPYLSVAAALQGVLLNAP